MGQGKTAESLFYPDEKANKEDCPIVKELSHLEGKYNYVWKWREMYLRWRDQIVKDKVLFNVLITQVLVILAYLWHAQINDL